MTEELIDRLRAMYVANGTNYVQAAADKLEAQAERIKFLEADRNLEKKMRKDADEYADTLRAQLAEIENVEPVIWAISHDGVTPYSLWHDGDGALLDNHVDRLGSPWQKMALYPVPSQNLKDAARYRWLVEYLVSNDTRHDKAIVACESTSELSAFIDTKVEKRG